MRGVIAFFMIVGMSGIGVHSLSGSGGGGTSERVIHADRSQIVEAMNRSLSGDGMEVVARSDSGDDYRLALTAEEMRQHPKFSRLAEQGDLSFNAHVTQERIDFTADFDSGLTAGFRIDMTPAPDGVSTVARVSPVIRDNGSDRTADFSAALSRNFTRYGEQTLETIANAAESDAPPPVL
jgi:hypothetical protein